MEKLRYVEDRSRCANFYRKNDSKRREIIMKTYLEKQRETFPRIKKYEKLQITKCP